MAHEVFISYAADDKSAADAVCAALERRQIGCWIAPRDARPGLDYADSIVDALEETSVMVFVVSSRSIVSPHVKREVEHAANSGTRIIPFRIEDVQLSRALQYFLGNVHWIDALTPPIDKHLDYLIETVQYFLDRKRAAETAGQVSQAAPGDPASRPVAPASIRPRDDLAPSAAVEESPATDPAVSPPAAPAQTPASHGVTPAAARAESPALPAAPTAKPAEPPPPAAARTIPPEVIAVPGTRPSEEVARARQTIPDVRSPSAEPVTGPAPDRPSALRPETRKFPWQVVGFGTIGAALGELLGFGILTAIFGSDPKLYMYAIGFAFMTIAPAGIVTWGWLYGVRQQRPSPAEMGAVGGLLGGALSAAITVTLFRESGFAGSFVISHALQWTAFGIAGGLAATRGRSARPAVSMSIALVSVCVVRMFYLLLQPRERDAFAFLLFDLPVAIGWGVGLIACPATTAALRQPQPPGDMGAEPAAEGPSALRPETGTLRWRVVRFAALGAALSGTLEALIARAVYGHGFLRYVDVNTVGFMTILVGIVTWCWLYGVQQRRLSPAAMGGLGGLLGGALAGAITVSLFHYRFPISSVLQWTAFGIAGGLAAGRSRTGNPAVSISIALVCVSFVRTLYYIALPVWNVKPFLFLLFDLATAIGWGIGLVLCPATTAALRRPQLRSDVAPVGGTAPPG